MQRVASGTDAVAGVAAVAVAVAACEAMIVVGVARRHDCR